MLFPVAFYLIECPSCVMTWPIKFFVQFEAALVASLACSVGQFWAAFFCTTAVYLQLTQPPATREAPLLRLPSGTANVVSSCTT